MIIEPPTKPSDVEPHQPSACRLLGPSAFFFELLRRAVADFIHKCCLHLETHTQCMSTKKLWALYTFEEVCLTTLILVPSLCGRWSEQQLLPAAKTSQGKPGEIPEASVGAPQRWGRYKNVSVVLVGP